MASDPPNEESMARLPGVLGHVDELAAEDNAVLRAVPDLRGVPAEDASGIHVGTLFGALAEADTGLLRYIDLELDTLDRHVLVPIGHARVHEGEREGPHFRLRAALLEQLEQIPPFPVDVRHIDDPFERALLEAYGRTFHGERYYAHPSYDHHGVFAGEHPVVADEAAVSDEPLARLSQLSGWRIAKGEPDVRGWDLVLDDDARLPIRDLIVDTAAETVRYVAVDALHNAGLRLLPIGYLRIETDARVLRAAGLTTADVTRLHAYDGGVITRTDEDLLAAALRNQFDGARRYHLPDFHPPIH